MLRLVKILLLVLLVLLLTSSELAAASYRGVVEPPWQPTVCIQESHFLTDPCTGVRTMLRESATLDLDQFLCQYVEVTGSDIGIECTVIQPASATPAPICSNQFDMWFSPDVATLVGWYRVGCATDYDLIRGSLSAVSTAASAVDLGPVSCVANDVPQPNNRYITGPTDSQTPPVGSAYFYVVRSIGSGVPDETYGHSSDDRERLPFSGDCAF